MNAVLIVALLTLVGVGLGMAAVFQIIGDWRRPRS
jgi:hypothetical protein